MPGGVSDDARPGAAKATGLSGVRIEPALIANETDPSARLTLGQNLTDQLKLVYSTNLADSNDQIWVAEYDLTRRFQTQAVRQEDASYRLDFRHDVRFGGVPAPRRQKRIRPTVTQVTVTSSAGQDMPDVRQKFRVEEGDAYDFFAIRKGLDRIEQSLTDQGYLQSKVRLERIVEAESAQLTLKVTRGPLVEIGFEGTTPPGKVQRKRAQWHRGVFDKQRADAGLETLRAWLMDDNYLQPTIRTDRGRHRPPPCDVPVEPGTRSEKVVLRVRGRLGDRRMSDKIIAQQKLERKLFTDPPS